MPPPCTGVAFSRHRSLGTGRQRSHRSSSRNGSPTRPVLHDRPQGGVLGVVPPVLEHGERHPGRPGVPDQRSGRRGVDGERLVDDAREAGVDDGAGLGGVHPARAREHDEVQPRHREQRGQVGHHRGPREVRTHLRRALAARRGHRDHPAAGLGEPRRVDAAARGAVADQADAGHGAGSRRASGSAGGCGPEACRPGPEVPPSATNRAGHQTRGPMS